MSLLRSRLKWQWQVGGLHGNLVTGLNFESTPTTQAGSRVVLKQVQQKCGAPPAAVSDPAAVANPAAVGALSRVPSGIPTANAAGHPESFGADRPAKRKFPGGPDVI